MVQAGPLKNLQLPVLFSQQSFGGFHIGHNEPYAFTGTKLCQLGQMGTDDMCYPGIAPGGLMVGHQYDQLPVRQQLDGSIFYAGRDQFKLFSRK